MRKFIDSAAFPWVVTIGAALLVLALRELGVTSTLVLLAVWFGIGLGAMSLRFK
jgi:hypothetical protein